MRSPVPSSRRSPPKPSHAIVRATAVPARPPGGLHAHRAAPQNRLDASARRSQRSRRPPGPARCCRERGGPPHSTPARTHTTAGRHAQAAAQLRLGGGAARAAQRAAAGVARVRDACQVSARGDRAAGGRGPHPAHRRPRPLCVQDLWSGWGVAGAGRPPAPPPPPADACAARRRANPLTDPPAAPCFINPHSARAAQVPGLGIGSIGAGLAAQGYRQQEYLTFPNKKLLATW
jgi:hypothetical protein